MATHISRPPAALFVHNPAGSHINLSVNYNVLTTYFPPKSEGSIDAEWVAKIKTLLPHISVLQAPKTLLNPEQQYRLIVQQIKDEFAMPEIVEGQKQLMSRWCVYFKDGETPEDKLLVRKLFIKALQNKYDKQKNYDDVMRLAEQSHLHPNLRHAADVSLPIETSPASVGSWGWDSSDSSGSEDESTPLKKART